MSRFFTADTHFRHNMVIAPEAMNRGKGMFESIEAHDDHLITQINKIVGKDDELFMLGDIAWADLPKLRPRIVCRHIKVVLGNHDQRSKLIHTFGEAPDTRIVKGVENVGTFFLSHYPHAFWPASHYGSAHLYGHMHAKREATLDGWMPERRSLDVGVDNACRLLGEYRPFSEDEILNIFDKGARRGHDPLEFYRGPNAQR